MAVIPQPGGKHQGQEAKPSPFFPVWRDNHRPEEGKGRERERERERERDSTRKTLVLEEANHAQTWIPTETETATGEEE